MNLQACTRYSSLTSLAKGSLRRSSSVLLWYFLISRRATVPGLNLCGFLVLGVPPPVAQSMQLTSPTELCCSPVLAFHAGCHTCCWHRPVDFRLPFFLALPGVCWGWPTGWPSVMLSCTSTCFLPFTLCNSTPLHTTRQTRLVLGLLTACPHLLFGTGHFSKALSSVCRSHISQGFARSLCCSIIPADDTSVTVMRQGC